MISGIRPPMVMNRSQQSQPRFAAKQKSRSEILKENEAKTRVAWDQVKKALDKSGLLKEKDLPGRHKDITAHAFDALGMIMIIGNGTPEREKAINDVISKIPGIKTVAPGQYELNDTPIFVMKEDIEFQLC